MFKKLISCLFFLTVTLPHLALAQSSPNGDWIKPASDLANTLQSGLVQIGGPIIGIGVIALGLWAGIAGRLEWQRVGFILLGGLLVTVGPAVVTALLNIQT